MTTIKELAKDERVEFVELLRTLEPEQWDAPTLCDKWRVRDVVAHVISYEDLGPATVTKRMAAGLFSLNRTNAIGVTEAAARTHAELLASFEQHLDARGLTAAFGGRVALLDGMIHQQDIRRPLGKPREIPAQRLAPALRFACTAALAISGPWRVRGLRLVATDIDFSHGRGSEVRGPGESLLLAVAGRRAVADELSGPGAATLVNRASG